MLFLDGVAFEPAVGASWASIDDAAALSGSSKGQGADHQSPPPAHAQVKGFSIDGHHSFSVERGWSELSLSDAALREIFMAKPPKPRSRFGTGPLATGVTQAAQKPLDTSETLHQKLVNKVPPSPHLETSYVSSLHGRPAALLLDGAVFDDSISVWKVSLPVACSAPFSLHLSCSDCPAHAMVR